MIYTIGQLGRLTGTKVPTIRQLLALADRPAASCEPVDEIVQEQLDEVDRRITILNSIRAELARMLAECNGGTVGRCRILEVLGDHSLCLADNHQK